ncbi:hypothetical protein BDZ89DRAFT_1131133 [Hymenopellis radicata]|nr:hypothetical protein BDZ89DRAFT_1131133 [Hymenopellis radicata]
MATQAQPQALALMLVLQHRQVVTYFDIASAVYVRKFPKPVGHCIDPSRALQLFDYFLTLSEEVELIWHARWNITKILYLLTRYLPFVDIAVAMWFQFTPNMSLDDCLVAYKMGSWMLVVGIVVAEALLTLRTWVVWNRHPYFTLAVSALFIAVLISALVVTGLFCRSLQFAPLPDPRLKGCLPSMGSSILLWDFGLLALYEGVMFILMAVKAYQQFVREAPVGSSQLLTAILKDGLLYYLYIAGISIMNIVLVTSLSRDLIILLALFKRAIHAILTCRTITNIRAQAKNQVIVGSSGVIDDLGTVSTFQVIPLERFR